MTLEQVADYYYCGKSTVKRWLMLSRRGILDFPMSINPKGCRLLWRRDDIIAWRSKIGNIPPEQPDELKIETPAERKTKDAKVAKGLAKMGVNFTKKG